jgi:hypothetical protein
VDLIKPPFWPYFRWLVFNGLRENEYHLNQLVSKGIAGALGGHHFVGCLEEIAN